MYIENLFYSKIKYYHEKLNNYVKTRVKLRKKKFQNARKYTRSYDSPPLPGAKMAVECTFVDLCF